MALPKKKISRARRDARRSHDSLRRAAPTECPNCGELKLPHHVCPSCGQYREREVLSPADDV